MCNCLERINARLLDKNTEVVYGIDMSTGNFLGVYLRTEKVDTGKRSKAAKMLATYCPFCGEKYAADQQPQRELGLGG